MIRRIAIAICIAGFIALARDTAIAQRDDGPAGPVETTVPAEPERKKENAGEARSGSAPFSQSKFVPDLSFVLDFSAVARDLEDRKFAALSIPEFMHGPAHAHEGHGHSHVAMNEKRGFNLNYGELFLFAPVDPYFELTGVLHLSTTGVEIEEGYFATTCLPYGFQFKGGKFFSGFGRINAQHAHQWDFSEQPLPYLAFFGAHGINEVGAQLTWLAPVGFYLLVGGEALQGQNESSFGSEGFQTHAGGTPIVDATGETASVDIDGSNGPNLYTGFVKTSFDIGDLTVMIGASAANGTTRINHELDEDNQEEGRHAVKAHTWVYGGELTLKYLIDSYRYVSLQGEYLHRLMDGTRYGLVYDDVSALDVLSVKNLIKEQSGWYAQLAVKPFLRWRFGVRYDALNLNRVVIDNETQDTKNDFSRASAMIEFVPSEFARIRLQYNYDRSRYETVEEVTRLKTVHEVILQFTMAIGAHGAHAF